MGEPPLRVANVMGKIEGDVRDRLRRHVVKRGGPSEYEDAAVFEQVRAVLARAADGRNLDALLLPELLDGDATWELQTRLDLSTHRPGLLGATVLLAKRRILLPLTRWLFEYSQDNFRRQHHLNRVLLACIEELAIDNARLRRDVSALSRKT